MEAYFLYLAKSSGILFIFWLVFKLILQKETFFTAHRWYLMGGIFTALLLPFVSFKKIVLIEAPKPSNINFDSFVFTEVAPTTPTTDWWQLLGIVYGIGVLVLSVRFLLQLISLYQLFHKCDFVKQGDFTLATTQKNISPFSFFKTIVYNPNRHTKEELKTILIHEKVHARQNHSLDNLLAHILTIFQWCNPMAWFYKASIGQNLEYIADNSSVTIIKNKKEYQYLLLQQSGSSADTKAITNPFFNSLIKKRIVMLNQQQSNRINLLKYSFILPLLGVFLFAFNTKTIAQVKEQDTNTELSPWKFGHGVAINSIEINIEETTTDDELNSKIKEAQETANIELKFSKIKRNSKGQIVSITCTYKTNEGKSGTYNIKSTEPIVPFVLFASVDAKGSIETIGYRPKADTQNIIAVIANKTSIGGNTESLMIKNLDSLEQSTLPAISKSITASSLDAKNTPLYIIDGEIMDILLDNYGLDSDNVESVSILKNEKATDIYGEKGKNGVVIISTKKVKNKIDLLQNASSKALYIVDGEEIEGNPESYGLAPEDIESVMFLKDKSATELYGDKGKNGVVQIMTKKAKEIKTTPYDALEKALFVIDGKLKDKNYDINKSLKPEDIKGMSILKGDAAIKRYGEKAKNGVIELTTKTDSSRVGSGKIDRLTNIENSVNQKTPDNFYVEAQKIIKDGKTYISGKVFSSDSPLPGVRIAMKNSKSGTLTDFNGQFTMAAEEGQTLLFQLVGFPDAALSITKDKTYAVSAQKK